MISKSVILEHDPATDDLILPLSDELCDELGWTVGDTINWQDNGDGTFTLTKKDSNDQRLEQGKD